MGWLWNSLAPKKDSPESQPTQPSAQPTQPPTQQQSESQKLSREEQADAEVAKLWASLQSDIKQAEQTQQASVEGATTDSATGTSALDLQSPPTSIAPESLYPDTMSCRDAFDYAFFCQSLGGQFVNVYRYGELRSCSEHWENFWLCMKTRTFRETEKKKIIRDHYRKKAIKYKTGPSSEDVWDVRTEPVKGCFQGDFAALEREIQAEEEAQARARHAANTV
ncbi:hypothetical protein AN5136.2 [Aspergillus nidulans FGSC A4]|uniref:Early meiotic induction protein 1 n=1 Tax=Emericella nidulans (strain FGSC A4 / ATCC 38163 / CBS 112.46 / NRRL 194 / M139) TaxID=227321 RepID=Q5B2U4_EMENI|nr:hypothetical protein [Aspergillus nidulans FGSC A4]EAA62317.1 hypothetical protein AN5136.2 [Aspergillus nidulans FGSC A4]CBF80927.1 TPA: hypothetical protein ANIA_05136 [Aspergillus nidulans FGSC A4]|eukprot:XP_662740.1 hypothetical protein AN5136.2 [Aspergillus nidulans FGSC A4]